MSTKTRPWTRTDLARLPSESLVITDVVRWQPRAGVAALEIPLEGLLP